MTSKSAPAPSLRKQLSLLLILLTSSQLPLAALENTSGSWPAINRDPGATRYSPLTQITPENVTHLKPAWIYHMKPAPSTPGAPETPLRPTEDQPLVIGDTMYVVTPYSRIVALDASTGREKWVFTLPGYDQASSRGAAWFPGDTTTGPSLIFGTTHGFLYSISTATGHANTTFGANGAITLRTPEVMHTGIDKSYILPSPPILYKNLIITGAGPGEGPGGAAAGPGPAGDTRAWDVHTGKLVWTFHSVPRPGETGHETWRGDDWKQRSGVNVWGYMTIDQERGIVYMPFGAPNNDRVGIDRPGNNLFGSSIVAADANTGKLLWYFQIVHHDIWDYDTETPPTLVDIQHDGQTIPALATVNKNGLLFFLNRVTGKPIYPVEERPVPASDVPGEHASPTQPFPTTPEPLAQNKVELYTGVPAQEAWCKAYVENNNMFLAKEPYTPPAYNRYSVGLPGTQGGVNFSGGAFDPTHSLFVVNVNNLAQPMRIIPDGTGSYINSGPLAGLNRFWNPDTRIPCNQTPWGELMAIDVNTGKIAWRSVLGITDSFPAGKQKTGRPGLGGPILTASNLTFIGATDDSRFRAFNTTTGQELWSYKLPASAQSIPITYTAGKGQQYVAIVATGGGLLRAPLTSDSVVAFKLDNATPGEADAEANIVQASPAVVSTQPLPPNFAVTPVGPAGSKGLPARFSEMLPQGQGRDLTIRACSTCHTLDVVANQHLAPQEWTNVVQTMSARGTVATPEELNRIQAYLAKAFPKSTMTTKP